MKKLCSITMTLAIVLAAAGAAADSLVPSPAADPVLGALAAQYDRQFFEFNAKPFGLSLDGEMRGEYRDLIAGFFEQDEDFETYASMHAFEVLHQYGEYGDLGMFGGMAQVGDALRYVVLRDGGAPAAEVEAARQDVIRAIYSWHMMQALPGVPGVVARGVMRIAPEDAGAPPIPGCCPATLPLFDGEGNPQPDPKREAWRDDQSGTYPDWVYLDDTSKDQVDGYATAIGALWDAVAADPTIPDEARRILVDDARALARKLMTTVPIEVDIIGTVHLDMVLTDADGRLVTWFGLNPRVIDESTPIIVGEGMALQNGFNALLGLSVMKVCHHITGDEDIAAFYYDQLITGRGWIDKVETGTGSVSRMYLGASTNFSNVNMAFTAIYSLIRYEGAADIRGRYQTILENSLYRPGVERQAGGLGQSWFDLIFAGLRDGGTDETAVAEAVLTLGEFMDPPYFNPQVINCDEGEIGAGVCTAIDGTTTITIASGTGHGGGQVAQDVLPKRLRPPSNFEWRSDPHDFNGGGGNRLNPGGDFRGAYWLGRFLQRSADNSDNISPFARDRWGGGPPDVLEEVVEAVEAVDGPMEEGMEEVFPPDFIGDDLIPDESLPDAADDTTVDGMMDVEEDAQQEGVGETSGGCGCKISR